MLILADIHGAGKMCKLLMAVLDKQDRLQLTLHKAIVSSSSSSSLLFLLLLQPADPFGGIQVEMMGLNREHVEANPWSVCVCVPALGLFQSLPLYPAKAKLMKIEMDVGLCFSPSPGSSIFLFCFFLSWPKRFDSPAIILHTTFVNHHPD